eukprot:GHVQ01004648.1.p1 GENE.GHVQ01004648.1~~GHVQ01004648.1.p1  ORF type:complete len:358 (-),score=79.63 GHVQ01004648.1:1456-2529(-)
MIEIYVSGYVIYNKQGSPQPIAIVYNKSSQKTTTLTAQNMILRDPPVPSRKTALSPKQQVTGYSLSPATSPLSCYAGLAPFSPPSGQVSSPSKRSPESVLYGEPAKRFHASSSQNHHLLCAEQSRHHNHNQQTTADTMKEQYTPSYHRGGGQQQGKTQRQTQEDRTTRNDNNCRNSQGSSRDSVDMHGAEIGGSGEEDFSEMSQQVEGLQRWRRGGKGTESIEEGEHVVRGGGDGGQEGLMHLYADVDAFKVKLDESLEQYKKTSEKIFEEQRDQMLMKKENLCTVVHNIQKKLCDLKTLNSEIEASDILLSTLQGKKKRYEKEIRQTSMQVTALKEQVGEQNDKLNRLNQVDRFFF